MSFDPERVRRVVAEANFGEGWYDYDVVEAENYDKLLFLLHDVASEADPAGTLRELRLAQDTVKALEKQVEELKGAARADEERLIQAAAKARIAYTGCDTPDWLCDRIADLEAEVSRLKEERK